MTKLTDIKAQDQVMISRIAGSGTMKARLSEMGFVVGQPVKKLYSSPLGNPIVFEIMGSRIALRREEAELIETTATPLDATQTKTNTSHAPHTPEQQKEEGFETAEIRFGGCNSAGSCSGCPGCNKEEPLNTLPEEDEITLALVGNPNCGKTSFFNAVSGGHEHTGNYSGVTVRSVIGKIKFEGKKVRIIDLPGTYSLKAFSPEEAFVIRELKKGHIDAVINIMDVTNLERNLLLTLQLKELKLPVVGALNMFDEFNESGSSIDIAQLTQRLEIPLIATVARQKEGIKETLRAAIAQAEQSRVAKNTAHNALPIFKEDNTARYAGIHRLLQGIYQRKQGKATQITDVLDKVVTNRFLAYPLFFLLLWFIFWTTFTLGQYPMEWIDSGIGWLSSMLESNMSEGLLRDLVVNGALGGVGSVIVFLPNILILYFLISILEDSGYLARAALLADPLLNKVGLHGKSFIPMLMGFGCNVPAIMATRTIENNKNRLITILIIPLMSCSARIPVYIILAGAFFPRQADLVMMGLYLLGTTTALVVAWMMNRLFMRNQQTSFVMELPPYRMPGAWSVTRHAWEKGRQYLQKMGGIILIASVVIWALGYFPRQDGALTDTAQQEQSYMGQIGHAIEPVIRPLGYDWRMGVGIIAGVGAKELMVSTLGVLYNCSEDDAAAETVEDASQTRLAQTLSQNTTSEAALSYLVFALFYFPCLATIVAIAGESGKWKWALFTAGYTTILAYTIAFITYKIAFLF